MLRLTERQRELAADKLADAGNLAAGAMIFGQSLAVAEFSIAPAVVGLALWAACLALAMNIRRDTP